MNELHQILNCEDEGKNKVLEAEKKAKKIVDARRGALAEMLEKESDPSPEEIKKLVDKKNKQIELITADFNRKLESEMKKMNEKKKNNLDKAVNKIINSSFNKG